MLEQLDLTDDERQALEGDWEAITALAAKLAADGYSVVRRYRFVLVGADSEEAARELAKRLHGEAEASGELVYEVLPQNPFVIFGGLGGSGTPL